MCVTVIGDIFMKIIKLHGYLQKTHLLGKSVFVFGENIQEMHLLLFLRNLHRCGNNETNLRLENKKLSNTKTGICSSLTDFTTFCLTPSSLYNKFSEDEGK